MKLIMADIKTPYFTVPKTVSSSSFVRCAASSAGLSINGVITSSINELTIFPKAAPITTPMARSITLPLMANALNSFKIVREI